MTRPFTKVNNTQTLFSDTQIMDICRCQATKDSFLMTHAQLPIVKGELFEITGRNCNFAEIIHNAIDSLNVTGTRTHDVICPYYESAELANMVQLF